MPVKLVPAIGYVRLKNPDNSLMSNDAGEPSYARMHSPASKTWEVATAARKRKSLKLVRESGGHIEAIADEPPEVIVDYLCAITEEFINFDAGEGDSAKAKVRSVFETPGYGYIRDQLDNDSKDWGAFLDVLPTKQSSTSDSQHG